MSAVIMRLVGAAMLCAAALALAPSGQLRQALQFVCAVVLVCALLASLGAFDWQGYALHLEEYRLEGEALANAGKDTAQVQTRLVIQQQCAAYILDKAQAMGLANCRCSVTAQWSTEGYWVPTACSIETACSDLQRAELTAWIEANLGIPGQSQQWSIVQ